MVKHLPSKPMALSSTPATKKKKRRKEKSVQFGDSPGLKLVFHNIKVNDKIPADNLK
jgi:hypothetical protein